MNPIAPAVLLQDVSHRHGDAVALHHVSLSLPAGQTIGLVGNTGKATGHDLELLGETVRARVLENSGARLEWEIKRIGRFGESAEVQPFLAKG